MKRSIPALPIALTALQLCMGASGCGKNEKLEGLSTLPPSFALQALPTGHVQADFCSSPPDTLQPILKIVFLVDQSGSNAQNPSGAAGSDYTGSRRFPPLINFVSTELDPDPTIGLAIVTYNTATVNSYPTSPTPFTNDRTAFANQIQSIMTAQTVNGQQIPKDSGYTDFIAALQSARDLIQADMAASCSSVSTRQVVYSIMMVSDGFPDVNDVPQSVPAILSAITDPTAGLITIPKGFQSCVSQVILSTGMYFTPPTASTSPTPPNPCAPGVTIDGGGTLDQGRALMCQMAAAGSGNFSLFPEAIDYSSFEIPARTIKFTLKDAIVRNTNLVWEGPKLLYDSDRDGISDQLEAQLGSNPGKSDSDGNGVSDLVEYRLFGTPCRDSGCAPNGANAFQLNLCKKIPFTTASDGTITYPDTDGDGLNDCEEALLQSSPELFTTDGSWVPDSLMFLVGLNVLADPKELLADWEGDQVTNYQKIKLDTPLNFPNNELQGLQTPLYSLTVTGAQGMEECYHLDVSQIPVMQGNDTMRIYLMDGSSVLTNRKNLRMVDRPLDNYELTLTPADFGP